MIFCSFLPPAPTSAPDSATAPAINLDAAEDFREAAEILEAQDARSLPRAGLPAGGIEPYADRSLGRRRRTGSDVPVAELLDGDREYRRKAEQGALRTIAPRRFNPEGASWLPILHTERDGRQYTALYSNTARAHELEKTDDWVVIYLEDAQQAQWTVVTETSGPLEGKRVVRGREAACRQYYETQASGSSCISVGTVLTALATLFGDSLGGVRSAVRECPPVLKATITLPARSNREKRPDLPLMKRPTRRSKVLLSESIDGCHNLVGGSLFLACDGVS